MKPFREYILEGVSDLRLLAGSSKSHSFWFNPKTDKLVLVGISSPFGPWHATSVVKDPKKFGTTKKEILNYMKKWDKEYKYYDDFGQTEETFYAEIEDKIKDISYGIEILMGEKGYFHCTVKGNLVSARLGNPSRGGVGATNSQWRKFVEKISLISKVSEIHLDGFSSLGHHEALYRTDFEFFIKYGRIPKRTEIGAQMAQFREERAWRSYPTGLLRADHKGSSLIYPTVRWPDHEGSVPEINRIELHGKMSSIFVKNSKSWEYWLKTKSDPKKKEIAVFSEWLKEGFGV